MAGKRVEFTILVVRNTDPKDYDEPDEADVVLTPGTPDDFCIQIDSEYVDTPVGDMVEEFHRRAAGKIVLEDSDKGVHDGTLLRFAEALAPFFPDDHDGTSPANMIEAFASRVLQEGIKIGMRMQAGEIIPRKVVAPNPA